MLLGLCVLIQVAIGAAGIGIGVASWIEGDKAKEENKRQQDKGAKRHVEIMQENDLHQTVMAIPVM